MKLQLKQIWIDAETKPQNGTEVLCYTEAGSYYVLPYYNGFNRREFYTDAENDELDMTDCVIAWMPLPEPPKKAMKKTGVFEC